jgi:hypothetical protein
MALGADQDRCRPGAARQVLKECLQDLEVEAFAPLKPKEHPIVGLHEVETTIEARVLLPADVDLRKQGDQAIGTRKAAT